MTNPCVIAIISSNSFSITLSDTVILRDYNTDSDHQLDTLKWFWQESACTISSCYSTPRLSSPCFFQAQWGGDRRGGGVLSHRRGDSRVLPQLVTFPYWHQPLRDVLQTQSCAGCPTEGPGHTEGHQCWWVSQGELCYRDVAVSLSVFEVKWRSAYRPKIDHLLSNNYWPCVVHHPHDVS